jgi:hypothetical protein
MPRSAMTDHEYQCCSFTAPLNDDVCDYRLHGGLWPYWQIHVLTCGNSLWLRPQAWWSACLADPVLTMGDCITPLSGHVSDAVRDGPRSLLCLVDYQPMGLAELARFIAAEPDFDTRWRLVVEFLKEYHREAAHTRHRLLADAPVPTGDERWDVLFAGLAEHLAMRDGEDAPAWSASRGLRRFWFPFDTPGARAGARACPGRVAQAGCVRRRLRDRRRVSEPSPRSAVTWTRSNTDNPSRSPGTAIGSAS